MNRYECPHCGSTDIENKDDVYICNDCQKWCCAEDIILDSYEPIEGLDF